MFRRELHEKRRESMKKLLHAGPRCGLAVGDGADLYFERRGAGPALLLISGGGGDSGYYAGLADILADEFTVLTYDRRGNSRSRLHGEPRPVSVAEQSADAIAVLRANGFAAAQVFGNSGGATIALDLAAHCPAAVTAAVCHEPPIPTVLPDPGPYLAVQDEIDQLLSSEGWRASFRRFQTNVLGELPPPNPAEHTQPRAMRSVLRMPGNWEFMTRMSGNWEFMTRTSGNWEFMTRYEIRPFTDYRPDLASIRGNRVRIALAYGAETTHLAAPEMCSAAATLLSAECAVLPGGHTAPLDIPGAFAAQLRELLTRTLNRPLTSAQPRAGIVGQGTTTRGERMYAETTFLDCPAYVGQDGTTRCGLPAAVEDSYTLGSTDGNLTCVKIRCPQGHLFNGPVDSLTIPTAVPGAAAVAARR
jgi:pimeloyl-ACP methyl ester carboxylesterase